MADIIPLHGDSEWHIECPNCGGTDWHVLTPDGGETYLDVSGYRCSECGFEVEIEADD